MRCHVEFRSALLRDPLPAIGGARVAEALRESLPSHGFDVLAFIQEDWGVLITLANEDFALSIGCGHYAEYADGHLCFIEPSTPTVRRWLKKISTIETVERLASAMANILAQRSDVQHMRWWTAAEAAGKPD